MKFNFVVMSAMVLACAEFVGQFKQLLSHRSHGTLDLRGQRRANSKLLAFDTINRKVFRQTVRSACQLHSFAHTESMRGTG